jgi:glycosyltransferase involved in cell wall biosynthesis
VVKNGAAHLAQCIESVLAQSWPGIEYIIIDGGSTDATLDIIRTYDDRLAFWVSEPDRGIFDAMNKGIGLATGELIGLLNADDWYEPGAVEAAATALLERGLHGVYYGEKYLVQVDMGKVYEMPASLEFWRGMNVCHQAMFVHREVYERLGGYDLRYRLAADFDFLVRALREGIPFVRLGRFVVNFRDTGASAQALGEGNREISAILRSVYGPISTTYLKNRLLTGYNLAAVAVGRAIGRLLGERALNLCRILFYRLFTRRGEDVRK